MRAKSRPPRHGKGAADPCLATYVALLSGDPHYRWRELDRTRMGRRWAVVGVTHSRATAPFWPRLRLGVAKPKARSTSGYRDWCVPAGVSGAALGPSYGPGVHTRPHAAPPASSTSRRGVQSVAAESGGLSDSWVGRNPPSVKAESPRVRRRGVSDARCPGCARETALYEDAAENERDHIVNWRAVPDRLRPECRALPCIDDQRRCRIGCAVVSRRAETSVRAA